MVHLVKYQGEKTCEERCNNNNNNNKYKAHILEVQRTWKLKTKVIPVIIGAIGTILKSLRQYLSYVPGKHEIKELLKTAVLGTGHILRKVLM